MRRLIVVATCAIAMVYLGTLSSCRKRVEDVPIVGVPSSQIDVAPVTAGSLTLKYVQRLQERNRNDDESDITALAESADGEFLAWGDDKGTIRVHSFFNNKTTTIRDMSKRDITALKTVRDLAFDDEGQLCWADFDGSLYLLESIEADGPQKIRHGLGPNSQFISSNLLPFGVLTSTDKFVMPLRLRHYLRFFEIETEKIYESSVVFPDQRGVNELVQCAARSPDGTLLMAVADGDCALLSLPDMKIIRRFGQKWGVSAAFSPDSSLVALGTERYGLFVWETNTGKLIRYIPFEQTSKMASLTFVGKDNIYIADLPLCSVDLNTGIKMTQAKVNACKVLISRSGDRLFVGLREGGVEVYAVGGNNSIRAESQPKTDVDEGMKK